MRLVATVFAVLVGFASSARADLSLSGSAGLGLLAGPMSWSGPALSGFGGSDHVDLNDTMAPALALGAGVFVGDDLTSEVAIGVAVDAFLVSLGEARLGYTTFGPGYQIDAEARAVLRRPGSPWIWRASAGVTQAGFASSGVDIGAASNVATPETLRGPSAALSLGRATTGLAYAFELRTAVLFSEHMTYVPIMLGARLCFGAH